MHPLPVFTVSCKQAFQAYLWNKERMISFVSELLDGGVTFQSTHCIRGQNVPITVDVILAWFGGVSVSAHQLSRSQGPGNLNTWSLSASKGASLWNASRFQKLLSDLAHADFVSAANEEYTKQIHYLEKIDVWPTNSRCIIVENSTGVEYFAQYRDNMWMMVSIGLQSASDRGRVTLGQFVYDGKEINPEVLHDHIGFTSPDGMQKLRDFLHDTVCILAGPNMSLFHDIYFESFNGAQYIRVELCQEATGNVFESGDLSFITRSPPGFSKLPNCNRNVAAEAMRAAYDDTHEQCMATLFTSNYVPIAIYKEYDIAKAVRVIPHPFAANRRRYAGIVSQRRLVVPTAATARYDHIEPTKRIHAVNVEQIPVNHEWLILVGITFSSVILALAAGYGVSRDSRVTAADVLTVVVTILALLLISLPQLYVSVIGGEYTIGELYRGCVPISKCLRTYGVAFLKECVRKGVDIERFVNGRDACFLMQRARGNIRIGPVQIRDLDDRWNYGVNGNGELCMTYKSRVGVMQLREKKRDSGATLRWWHCAMIEGTLKREMSLAEVIRELGDGEVG